MAEITSIHNDRIKYIHRLREDGRLRNRDGVTLVEGKYEIELALSRNFEPLEIIHSKELSGDEPIAGIGKHQPVSVTRSVFEKVSHREGPDGWLAIFQTPSSQLATILLSPVPFLLLAEAIEKPGNLGAILRTTDAVGVDGVIVCDKKVDLYSPNVIRASRGTIFSVPCVQTSGEEALAYMAENKISIIAATPSAETIYSDIDLTGPICIAVGTESTGLSETWINRADTLIKIPMMGCVNSLNVSISSAIILYEVLRQRLAKK